MKFRAAFVLLVTSAQALSACGGRQRASIPAVQDSSGNAVRLSEGASYKALLAAASEAYKQIVTADLRVNFEWKDTTTFLFGPATSGASIEVFNNRTGKIETRAVAVGGTPAACAAAAADAAWSGNFSFGARHLKGYLFLVKDQFVVTARGSCQSKEVAGEVPFKPEHKTIRPWIGNSEDDGPWHYKTESIVIPDNCRHVKHSSHIWTANPNEPSSPFWSQKITESATKNGIVSLTLQVGAAPRNVQWGSGNSVGSQLDVDMQCL